MRSRRCTLSTKTGDTILDAVARLEDVTISERFGTDVATGRITLNDEGIHRHVRYARRRYDPDGYVPSGGSDVVRLHQSVQSENGKDYFPETLQNPPARDGRGGG